MQLQFAKDIYFFCNLQTLKRWQLIIVLIISECFLSLCHDQISWHLVINHNSKKLLAKTMVQISKRLVNQKKKFYKILCMNLFYCPLTSYYAAYFVSYSSLVRPRPNLQKNRVWGFRFWNLFKWVNEDGFFGFLMFFFTFNDCF